MPWTRATHLDRWADTESAFRRLPLLIRKLIRRTVPGLTKLNVPANEQTVRPDFDGIVECSVGNQYVPSGKTVWEMGTDKKPQPKANGDIAKRTKELSAAQRAETTFVFVTPRPWHKKDEWAKKKAREGEWKGVVVHDSNDLEHWLDLARDVDAWISHETNQIPPGVQSLERYWQALRAIGVHALRPEVFTASRETEIQSVKQLLSRDPDSLFIRTPGLSDGIDFLAALAAQQSEEFQNGDPAVEPQHLSLLTNAVIVFNHDDWRQLGQSEGPLLLIASPMLQLSSTDVASAVQAGHYVVVSGPRSIVPSDKGVQLRGVQQYELEKALEASGYSESNAKSIAKSCAGNTTILRRRIAKHPDTVLPAWAKPEVAPDLAFFALLGGWAHIDPKPPIQKDVPEVFRYVPPIDLEILELVGFSMNSLDRLIAQWQEPPEPYFLRFADSVLVTSREDAWYLLGDYVTDKQLQQFGDLAILVLQEDNPALELEPDQRWTANIYGKRHSMSGELRRSLVETLAIMATCPTVKHPTPRHQITATNERVITAVLPTGCDWKRWASLRSHFGVIAEAAPEIFLRRIEDDLKSPAPALPQLFREQTGSLFGGWLHCELLWALEAMAWSPDYLARVSVILAKLVSLISMPGNQGNRPDGSLQEIFLLWLPHTNATIDERIAALRLVLKIEPAAGWRLLLGILPSFHGVSHNSSMPRWRPWADGWSRESVNLLRYDYEMAVADLVLEQIEGAPDKSSDALEGMLQFNDEVTERVFTSLQRTADAFQANPDDAYKLWDQLRSTIQSHQKFPEADWAFSAETIEALINVRDQLVPTEPVLKCLWLFDRHVELPGFNLVQQHSDHDAALDEVRSHAIREINSAYGFDGILRLMELGADAHTIGNICGRHGLITEQEARLPQSLTEADKNLAVFAAAYVIASYYDRGEWSWVQSLHPLNWSVGERTNLALCLPFGPQAWDWVESQEPEVQTAYWSRKRAFLREWDETTVRRAVAGLLAAGRPWSAIDLVNFHGELDRPSDLIAEVLEAGMLREASEEIGDISYDIQQLIGSLQKDASFDRQRLGRIEWGYLSFLERSYSNTGPKTLVAAALESPSFYLELIQSAYRGKIDPPTSEDSEKARFHARRAIEFLDHMDRLPGTDDIGHIDSPTLDAWVKSTLELSETSGHSEITAHKIGQFMGRAIYRHLDNAEVLSQLAPVVESHGNEDLTDGIVNGIINSRGVTSRSPFDGGTLEHELAAKFGERAKAIRQISPKLAKCFTTIQSHYEHYALREDEDAKRLRSGR